MDVNGNDGQLWSYLNTLCHDEWQSCKLLVMCIGFQASGGAGFAGDALRSPWGELRRRQWDDGEPRAVRTRAGQGYIGIYFWLQWIFVSGRADVHGDLAAQRRYTVYYTNLYYLVCWEILGPRMGNLYQQTGEKGWERALCSIAISNFCRLKRKSNEGQRKAFGFWTLVHKRESLLQFISDYFHFFPSRRNMRAKQSSQVGCRWRVRSMVLVVNGCQW